MQHIHATVSDSLAADGFRSAFLPYRNLAQIVQAYDDLARLNPDIPNIQNAVAYFHSHQPPDLPFEPKSFLVGAYPASCAQIVVTAEGRRLAIPIPPTYLDDTPERQRLRERLEQAAQDFQTAPCRGVSQKLLAVLSGLGRFGRNNICYVGSWGSYVNLKAFYTDIPCADVSYPIRFMDACKACDLCRQNCPTGAIGAKTAIDAGLCLTLHNENDQPLPDWLPPDVHHALIGCLRCQTCCPQNPPLPEKDIKTLEGFFKGYVVKPKSWKEHKVAGLPAASFLADYEDKEPMVEYRTYILGKGHVYWFVFRAPKEGFEALRPTLDTTVNGLKVQ